MTFPIKERIKTELFIDRRAEHINKNGSSVLILFLIEKVITGFKSLIFRPKHQARGMSALLE